MYCVSSRRSAAWSRWSSPPSCTAACCRSPSCPWSAWTPPWTQTRSGSCSAGARARLVHACCRTCEHGAPGPRHGPKHARAAAQQVRAAPRRLQYMRSGSTCVPLAVQHMRALGQLLNRYAPRLKYMRPGGGSAGFYGVDSCRAAWRARVSRLDDTVPSIDREAGHWSAARLPAPAATPGRSTSCTSTCRTTRASRPAATATAAAAAPRPQHPPLPAPEPAGEQGGRCRRACGTVCPRGAAAASRQRSTCA